MTAAPIRGLGLAATFLVGISSVMVAGLKPLLVTLYITRSGFSTTATGIIVAAEMSAAALSTIGIAGIPATRRRALALGGLLLLLTSDLLSMTTSSLVAFGLVRSLAGVGEGIGAGVMVATIARVGSPERLMGAYNGIALIVLAIAFPVLPRLATAFGMKAVFLALAASTLPALGLLRWFPTVVFAGSDRTGATWPIPISGATLALLGTAAFYLALGGLWPFISEIGRAAGLATSRIAATLSLAQIAGAIGSFLPMLIGQRLGRTLPLVAAVIGTIIAVAGLLQFGAAACFPWAVPLFLGSSMMFFAYLMGVIASLDPGGRVSSLSISIQTLGLGLGPAWGGLLVTRFGVPALLLVALASLPLSLCALVPLALQQDGRRMRRQLQAADLD